MSPLPWGSSFDIPAFFMTAKPCGLIAAIPAVFQARLAQEMPGIAKRFKHAALILEPGDDEAARQLISAAQRPDIAVLLASNVDLAVQFDATGVYLPNADAGAVTAARQRLPNGAIIGAGCGLSRHSAMETAEAGADFVVFGNGSTAIADAAALCAWWEELSGVPVALDCGTAWPDAGVAASARADFLMVQESMDAGVSLNSAIELGLQGEL